MKRRILTITYSNLDRTDGPVIHYMELWNSFVRQFGSEFEVVGAGCITNRSSAFLLKNEFPVYTVSSAYPRPLRLLIQDLYFTYKILSHRKDIIYLRTGNNMCFSVLAARLLRTQLYTEYNGIASMDAASNRKGALFTKFVAAMEKLAIRGSRGCIAVSTGIEMYLTDRGAKRTTRIQNGVSPSFFEVESANKHAPTSVVYVGTFTPWDGAVNIVSLAAKFPAVNFHLVGDGLLRKSVEKAVRSDNVHFHGFVSYSDLPIVYSQHDAGIILYEVERNSMELSSLKTLEYLASGLPIFSTRVPGQEFIEKAGIGMLSTMESIETRFSEFLLELPALKQRVDEYRKGAGKGYSWDRAAVETRDFLQAN